jgi:homoserine acetyltransferase
VKSRFQAFAFKRNLHRYNADWAIGIGEAQRFSIMADAKFNGGDYDQNDPPRAGLATSRMMAMLSYRAPASVDERFSRQVMNEKLQEPDAAGEGGGGGGLMRKPSTHADLGSSAVAHANEVGGLYELWDPRLVKAPGFNP